MKKVIFLGTPYIARVVLEEIFKLNDINIVAVFTQPDREYNRQKQTVYSEVKQFCMQNNIQYFQPENINSEYELIKEFNPDLIVTCAYGQFISQKILSIPLYQCVNFHASLLPRWRGGAPIHKAIIAGDKKTGITLMYMDQKMDAGNIIKSYPIKIDFTDTYSIVYQKLCATIPLIVANDFKMLFDKNLKSKKQDESLVTYAFNLKKEDTIINFDDQAINIYNLIRGLNNKPVAKINFKNQLIKIYESQITNQQSNSIPGKIVNLSKDGIFVATQDYDIVLKVIQLPSKKINHMKELINGVLPFKINDNF